MRSFARWSPATRASSRSYPSSTASRSRPTGYEGYDGLLASGEIDAVYIALPNAQHREYAERAARHGVHVLCEKPMALTSRECESMVRAAREADVKLMIAYRLHFEEANLKAIELVKSGKLGDIRCFDSVFSMQVRSGNIRARPEDQGGGPLYDIGIYCINAARYLMRAEPVEVLALGTRLQETRFRGVSDTVSAILRFPGERIASFTCSFSSSATASYQVVGTKGRLRVENAYEYAEGMRHEIVIEGRKSSRGYAKRDQFAPELIHFSECVLRDREPEPSGLEGLADIRVIEAIQRSLFTGRVVRMNGIERGRRVRRPDLKQEIRRPALREPRLIKVRQASREE
jgi:glucose-fructose oxidoreductase